MGAPAGPEGEGTLGQYVMAVNDRAPSTCSSLPRTALSSQSDPELPCATLTQYRESTCSSEKRWGHLTCWHVGYPKVGQAMPGSSCYSSTTQPFARVPAGQPLTAAGFAPNRREPA